MLGVRNAAFCEPLLIQAGQQPIVRPQAGIDQTKIGCQRILAPLSGSAGVGQGDPSSRSRWQHAKTSFCSEECTGLDLPPFRRCTFPKFGRAACCAAFRTSPNRDKNQDRCDPNR